MKKSTLKWIIALMGLSLVGLVGFQLYWIDTVIKANEERFTKDVLEAMNNVALKLEKQETVAAFNKFRNVSAINPKLQTSRAEEAGLKRDAIEQLKKSQLRMARTNPNRHSPNMGHQIFVMDTLQMGDGFQVVFNYEFTDFGPPPVFASTSANADLEIELEQKQSEIDQLEDQLEWISKKYEMTASVLDDLLTPGRKLANRFNPEQLDSLLRMELREKGIELSYDYGVVSPALQQFVVLKKPEVKEQLENSTLRAGLFPNDLHGNRAFLVVDFPGKSQYLLQKIWLTMVSSGVLVLVIVLCFGYSIKIILQQKKLSLMKNDFINNMTHEFKTPIATVSLATEALQDREVSQSDDMRKRYIKMIQEENRRLGTQVERVLQIAAIEKQDFNLNLEVLDIHSLIQSLIENMKIQVESRGGRIAAVLSAAVCEIKGDETHITNCILNLLDNANKYSPDSPNIIVRTESNHTSLIISVQDHGMGMSKETQKHVFEKFYRLPTGNRHDVKGFGLGLSYVKSMVEAHQGTVSVDSTPGKGSTFTITLPLN